MQILLACAKIMETKTAVTTLLMDGLCFQNVWASKHQKLCVNQRNLKKNGRFRWFTHNFIEPYASIAVAWNTSMPSPLFNLRENEIRLSFFQNRQKLATLEKTRSTKNHFFFWLLALQKWDYSLWNNRVLWRNNTKVWTNGVQWPYNYRLF